jgi:LysM repeat protein
VTGTTGVTGAVPLAGLSGQQAKDFACSNPAPRGFGYYKLRRGDTLQVISANFGVPVERILELNPGSPFAIGNIILLPGVEAPGMWNVQDICPSNSGTSK